MSKIAFFAVALLAAMSTVNPFSGNQEASIAAASESPWDIDWNVSSREPTRSAPEDARGRPTRSPENAQKPTETRDRQEAPPRPAGRWQRVLITVYTPFDVIDSGSGFQDGFTSTMVNTRSGDPNDMYGIAADPRAIPYETPIYVPGYWEALQRNERSRPTRMTVVDDTGGMMRRNWRRGVVHLDLRFRTGPGARNWIKNNAHRGVVDPEGRLWMDVFIYER